MLKPLSYEESKKLFFEIIQDQDPGQPKDTTDKSKINKDESQHTWGMIPKEPRSQMIPKRILETLRSSPKTAGRSCQETSMERSPKALRIQMNL
jgi:hypothetical protein